MTVQDWWVWSVYNIDIVGCGHCKALVWVPMLSKDLVCQIFPLPECVGGTVTASVDNLDAFTNCTIISGDLRIS